jgi:hypothetical protein
MKRIVFNKHGENIVKCAHLLGFQMDNQKNDPIFSSTIGV